MDCLIITVEVTDGTEHKYAIEKACALANMLGVSISLVLHEAEDHALFIVPGSNAKALYEAFQEEQQRRYREAEEAFLDEWREGIISRHSERDYS